MTAVRKFTFDTVFTPEGGVSAAPARERLTYKRDEVEEIRKASVAEGEASAVAAAEARTATALEAIAHAVNGLSDALNAARADMRRDAVDLAFAAARASAQAALDHFPEEALAAAFADTLDALRDEPVIVATVAAEAAEAVAARLATLADAGGLAGSVRVETGPGPARIEWSGGAVMLDPDAALARAREAADRWLATAARDGAQLNLFDAPDGAEEA